MYSFDDIKVKNFINEIKSENIEKIENLLLIKENITILNFIFNDFMKSMNTINKPAVSGNLKLINLLMKYLNNKINKNNLLEPVVYISSTHNHLSVVKSLYANYMQDFLKIKKSHLGYCIAGAARRNHVELVKFLRPMADQLGLQNAFCSAAECGHLDLIKFLLPYINPEFDDFKAFKFAVRFNRQNIINLLINFYKPSDFKKDIDLFFGFIKPDINKKKPNHGINVLKIIDSLTINHLNVLSDDVLLKIIGASEKAKVLYEKRLMSKNFNKDILHNNKKVKI
jgi:hypothetical protein